MRAPKKFAIAMAAWLCPAITVWATDNAPIHFHASNVTVIIHKQPGHIKLNLYPAKTFLDKKFTINCRSANGCLVTVQSQAQLPYPWAAHKLCTHLDGAAMSSACSPSDSGQINNLQSELVSEGAHTLQTEVSGYESIPVHVCPCEVHYSIYEGGDTTQR